MRALSGESVILFPFTGCGFFAVDEISAGEVTQAADMLFYSSIVQRFC